MLSILGIIIELVILIVSTIGLALIFSQKDKEWYKLLLIGFVSFLGSSQLIAMIVVYFQLNKLVLFSYYILVILIGIFGFIKNKSNIIFNKLNIILLLVYLVLMVYIISIRTIGIKSFDTVFYLSLVGEGSARSTLGMVNYQSGEQLNSFYLNYDFQSYYYMNSFALWVFDKISNIGFNTNIYIWSMNLWLCILNYCIVLFSLNILKVENKLVKIIVFLTILGFMGNFYWNNALGFFGNSFRLTIISIITLWIYQMFSQNRYSYFDMIILGFGISSAIACSSSSLFIVVIIIYSLIIILLKKNIDNLGTKILAIISILLVYILVYLRQTTIFGFYAILIFILILFIFLLIYDFIIVKDSKIKINNYVRIFMVYIIPIMIYLVSIVVMFNKGEPNLFFSINSKHDMVWDYFGYYDRSHLVFNLVIYISLILYVIKTQFCKEYRIFILMIFIYFVNPLSYYFVEKYMGAFVTYRYFDTVFNYFTIILLIVSLYKFVNNNKVVLFSGCLIFAYLSFTQANLYYNVEFIPTADYNPVYRTENSKIEVISFLKEMVGYENDDEIIIVSQIEEIQAYISNIYTPISFASYRKYDRYIINESPSDLLNIFIVREYSEQKIFSEKPKYECACDLLIENNVDYVIIRKDQFYIDETGYVPFNYRVRDCADSVFESDTYLIYKFYWN